MRYQHRLLAIASLSILAGASFADFTVTKSLKIKPPKAAEAYKWKWTWSNAGTNDATEDDVTDTKTKDGSGTVANPPAGSKQELLAQVGGTFAKTTYSLPTITPSGTEFAAKLQIDGITKLGAAKKKSANISHAGSILTVESERKFWDKENKKWEVDIINHGSTECFKGQLNNNMNDPMYIRLHDFTTGLFYEQLLFEWNLDVADGFGEASETGLHLNAQEATFTVSMPGVWTTQGGWARVRVSGGVVVESEGVGFYAGLLPALGTTGPLNLNMTNAHMDLDTDLMPDLDGHEVGIFASIGVGGESHKSAVVPEPGSIIGLGLGALALLRRKVRR